MTDHTHTEKIGGYSILFLWSSKSSGKPLRPLGKQVILLLEKQVKNKLSYYLKNKLKTNYLVTWKTSNYDFTILKNGLRNGKLDTWKKRNDVT